MELQIVMYFSLKELESKLFYRILLIYSILTERSIETKHFAGRERVFALHVLLKLQQLIF